MEKNVRIQSFKHLCLLKANKKNCRQNKIFLYNCHSISFMCLYMTIIASCFVWCVCMSIQCYIHRVFFYSISLRIWSKCAEKIACVCFQTIKKKAINQFQPFWFWKCACTFLYLFFSLQSHDLANIWCFSHLEKKNWCTFTYFELFDCSIVSHFY